MSDTEEKTRQDHIKLITRETGLSESFIKHAGLSNAHLESYANSLLQKNEDIIKSQRLQKLCLCGSFASVGAFLALSHLPPGSRGYLAAAITGAILGMAFGPGFLISRSSGVEATTRAQRIQEEITAAAWNKISARQPQ